MHGPTRDTPSDEELVRRYQTDPVGPAGGAAANELMLRYHGRMYQWCYRMVREREQALDLAQDAMVDALRGLRSFEHRSRFSSWLFMIVRRRCLTALRPRMLRRDEDVTPEEIWDPGGGPEQEWIEREGEAALERLIVQHLDPLEQEAIWMRCVERLPVDEITRLLGLDTASGARGLLQTARRKLRAALKREETPTRGDTHER
jgi:RNA polymerase sigma-70 factor (ECF subfamily)